MRIYLAGLIQTGFVWRGNSRSEDVLISEDARKAYPWDLESFFYLRETKNAPAYFRENKKSIFLDSGAYTMFTKGGVIKIEEYSSFIKQNQDIIHVASNLDVIGAGHEEETYRNQKTLERMGVDIKPVYHSRDDEKWLKKYLAEGYDYIFLGGATYETTNYFRGWLDYMFGKYLTKKDGTAKVKVHGFGLTTVDLLRRYPWYSVDSTRWVLASRFGTVLMDLPHGDMLFAFSDQSPQRKTLGNHYDSCDPITKKRVNDYLAKLGYDPKLLRTSYGWRDHFNIGFFKRMMDRPEPRFNHKLQVVSLF